MLVADQSSQKTILLVEDEALIAMATARRLQAYGYEVITVCCGEDAVDKALSTPALDLVLMDINLGPGIDGTEAAQMILRARDIPVVFLSGHTSPDVVEKTEKITSYGYIVKGSNETVLVASIKMAFKLHEAHQNNRAQRREIETAYQALHQSEGRLRMVTGNTSDIILQVDCSGIIQFINRVFEGQTLEQVVGSNLVDWIVPDEHARVTQTLEATFTTGTRQIYDTTRLSRDGLQRQYQVVVVPVVIDQQVTSAIYTITDISERKQVEAHQAYQAALLQNITDAVIATNLDLEIVSWNEAATRIYGWTAAEAIGEPIDALLKTEFLTETQAQAQAFLQKNGFWKGEVCQQTKNGRTLFIEASVSWVVGVDGSITTGVTVNRDITGRKESERLLYESEKRYRQLAETLLEGIWVIDRDNRSTYVNPHMGRILGYAVDEMVGKTLFDFMDEQGAQLARHLIERRRQGIRELHEFEFIHKDGRRIYAALNACPVLDENGTYIGAIAGVEDITERRKATDNLKDLERRYHQLFESIGDAIVIHTADGRILDCNPAACALLGYTRAELLRLRGSALIPPDYAARMAPEIAAVRAGQVVVTETEYRHKDGYMLLVEAVARMIEYQGQQAFLVAARDIYARKEAERLREESEKRYRTLVEVSPDPIALCDLQGRFITLNPAGLQQLGYASLEELQASSLTAYDMLVEEECPRAYQNTSRVIENGMVQNVEYRLRRRDGRVVQIELSAALLRDAAGTPTGFLTMTRDIGQRKQSEAELRQYEKIVASTPDAIAVLDRDYRYRMANPAYEKFFGVPSSTLSGKSVADLLGPDAFERLVKPYFDRCLQGETVRYQAWFDFPTLGGRLMEITSFPNHTAGDQIDGLVAVTRDITDLHRLAEEKSTLLNDLQHRIKNSLALITSLIDLEQERADHPETKSALIDLSNRVRSLASLYAILYEAKGTQKIQLDLYLEKVARELIGSYLAPQNGLRINFSCERVMVDARQATSLGLILNELLTNTVKHAFPDRQPGQVWVRLQQLTGWIELEVANDGTPPPSNFDPARSPGLGLQIVQILAAQLKGNLTYNQGERTVFRVQVPER